MRAASTAGSTSERPTGSDVRSAASGVVAFAGRLPRQGLCLTVRTEDGWSVTLVHLGSIGVPVGTQVGEGDVVGTIGPSGEPEGTEPYVHLGIRLTADPNGYVDPLTLLPPRQAPEQVPPVQQTSQVQPPAPPVAAPARRCRHAPPRGAGIRSRRKRVSRNDPLLRRGARQRLRLRARCRGCGPTQRGLAHARRSPSRVRAVRARSSRARRSRGAPDTSARSRRSAPRRRGRARRRDADLRRRSWKRGRVARGGSC